MDVNPQSSCVLVTGGSGYVASWIVHMLLQQGYQVHTTVRDKTKQASIAHFQEMPNAAESLRVFEADLLTEGSFAEAIEGCDRVIHTASPFVFMDIQDAQHQLIDPAVKGTENLLRSVSQSPTVKRVVLTSSIASIYGDNIDCTEDAGRLDESRWNSSSSVQHQPYSYSKVAAERRAWEICAEQDSWDLVSINPGMIFGPALVKTASFSVDLLRQIGDGRLWPAVPDLQFAAVDVRDVAEAHLRAAFDPAAEGRYLVAAEVTDFLSIAKTLAGKFNRRFKFPFMVAPKFLIWLLAPVYGLKRPYIANNVGHHIAIDNSKSKSLGIDYRPVPVAVTEHYQQLVDLKMV